LFLFAYHIARVEAEVEGEGGDAAKRGVQLARLLTEGGVAQAFGEDGGVDDVREEDGSHACRGTGGMTGRLNPKYFEILD
jgi:hypothetical protein